MEDLLLCPVNVCLHRETFEFVSTVDSSLHSRRLERMSALFNSMWYLFKLAILFPDNVESICIRFLEVEKRHYVLLWRDRIDRVLMLYLPEIRIESLNRGIHRCHKPPLILILDILLLCFCVRFDSIHT